MLYIIICMRYIIIIQSTCLKYAHNSEYYLQVLFIIYELPMIVADLLSVTLWPLHVSCST